jgi:hypothetical protein
MKEKWHILLVFFVSLFLSYSFVSAQGELNCEIRDFACGDTEPVEVFQIFNTINSHVAEPGQDYTNRVCCGGVLNLSNSCVDGVSDIVLRLSSTTNAHARKNIYSDYPGGNKVCLSVPSGIVDVLYVAGNTSCPSGYAALASMDKDTNSHVGDVNAYNTTSDYKVCASAAFTFSSAIAIRAQDYTTSIANITFPEGSPNSIVSQPFNNVDSNSSPQFLGGAGIAKPVATLFNDNMSSLKIWYNISTFSNDIVLDEYYLINNKGAACLDESCVSENVVFDTDTDTGIILFSGSNNEKDLYLKVNLSGVAGKTGSSTITILGETL